MPITIDDLHPVYASSETVDPQELDRLESEFGADLPRGFRAFLMKFGHGWINDWLQFYCPDTSLLQNQRERLLVQFDSQHEYLMYEGPDLTRDDIAGSIQVGIVTDDMHLFACPRYPGSLFDWSEGTISHHNTGIELLDPFAALHMEKFAYFTPLQPVPENGYVVCSRKKLAVGDVVQAIRQQCGGAAHQVDVGGEIPAFWVFASNLSAKFHIFAGRDSHSGNVYTKYCTSPEALSKVETAIHAAEVQLGVQFKPASSSEIAV